MKRKHKVNYKQRVAFDLVNNKTHSNEFVYTGHLCNNTPLEFNYTFTIYNIQILADMLRKFPTTLFYQCTKLSWCWEGDNYNRIYLNKHQFTMINKFDVL